MYFCYAISMKIDWDKVRTEYITSTTPVTELCTKYGASRSAIMKRVKADGWKEQRDQYRASIVHRAIKRKEDKQVDRLCRLKTGTEKLIETINDALEDEEQFHRYLVSEGGAVHSETVEKTFRKVDTKAIRDLTMSLRELNSLMRNLYGMPTQQEAEAQRVAAERLKLDQQRAEREAREEERGNSKELRVVFDDGLEELAK